MTERWWNGDAAERYWLEATDRDDIGADLRAPLEDAAGRENWRYTLFRDAGIGDIVFHYDGRHVNGIVGWSRIAGPPELRPIVWKARGSYARGRGAVATELPGYRIPLEGYTPLGEPLTLAQLRAERDHLTELTRALEADGKQPLYFPFELSDRRELRPMQGYAFKLPARFVDAFPQLHRAEPGDRITQPAIAPSSRNPTWSRDELILALDLYLTAGEVPRSKASVEIAELSDLLGRMARVLGYRGNPDYRNTNGVYMKMMNFRRLDPAYVDAGKKGLSRGNKDEAIVWDQFAHDRAHLIATAAAIRAAVLASNAELLTTTDDEGIEEAVEGRVLTRVHRIHERNRELVETRKARQLKVAGRLQCEACDFDFYQIYGERGRGFIEAHHTRPVHTLAPMEKTRLADLALLCANCHRMIHARRRWLNLDELRTLIRAAGTDADRQSSTSTYQAAG